MPVALDDVTLCCIDTAQPAAALRAMRASRAQCRFARSLLLTDRPVAEPGVEVHIVAPLDAAGYSRVIFRDLAEMITTPFVLVVQWDGYVLDGSRWDPEFLTFDYIGAPWPWHADAAQVGNGGFSLRSRRLLRALAEFQPVHPEDEGICRTYRRDLERRGLVFADVGSAGRFAFERGEPEGPTFGFHGLFNMGRVLAADELGPLLDLLSGPIHQSVAALDLLAAYARGGRWREAREVLVRLEARVGADGAARLAGERDGGGPAQAARRHAAIHRYGAVLRQ